MGKSTTTPKGGPIYDTRAIPVEQIEVAEDFNPRLDFDAEAMKVLTASIKQHGVLTPITVEQLDATGKRYRVVAGERRLRAVRELGHQDVPATVKTFSENGEGEGKRLGVALVENLVRSDLSPVEEAKGYAKLREGGSSPTQIAKQISVSKERVESRLALLALPEAVQDHIAGGRVPLRCQQSLGLIASFSPRVAEAASTMVAAGLDEPGELANSPGDVVSHAERYVWTFDPPLGTPNSGDAACPDCQGYGYDGDEDAPDCKTCEGSGRVLAAIPEGAVQLPIVKTWGGQGRDPFNFAEALIGAEAVEQLNAKLMEAIPPAGEDYGTASYHVAQAWRGAASIDEDAARAYGCLMELPGGNRSTAWVTDAEWLIAAFDAQIAGAVKSWKRSEKDSDRREGKRKEADPEGADERKAEREKAEAARVKAQKHNDKLYEAILTGTAKVKPTVENVKLLAALIFQSTDGWLAFEGVGLTDPTFHETSSKTGKRKYAKGAQARRDTFAAAWRRVESAKTPEAVMGALLAVLVAEDRVDKNAVARSDYRPSKLPAMSYHPEDADRAIQKVKEAGLAAAAKSIGAPSKPRD